MILSVTRLRLRSVRFLPSFMWHASRSFRQSVASPGNRRSLVRRIGLSFWTLTAWQDETSLREYILGGAHGRALPKLKHWCDEASTARRRIEDRKGNLEDRVLRSGTNNNLLFGI